MQSKAAFCQSLAVLMSILRQPCVDMIKDQHSANPRGGGGGLPDFVGENRKAFPPQ